MTTDSLVLGRDTTAVSAAVRVGGQARGRLIGGNLTAVATSVGVRLPDLTGAILFLEAHRKSGWGWSTGSSPSLRGRKRWRAWPA